VATENAILLVSPRENSGNIIAFLAPMASYVKSY